MRIVGAHYEKGLLKPTEPLSLRQGERVNLIVVRQADKKRWDLDRLTKAVAPEELSLTELGLADWAVGLEKEDGR